CGREIRIAFRVSDNNLESLDPPVLMREETARMKQPRDTLPLNPHYTFDSFVRGKNNQLAHAASIAVAERPGKAYNPFFIYGNVGLGKTHLLQAIGNFLIASGLPKTVVYTTSERFAIELINSIRNNTTASFREKYRRIDLLLIDDVHFLQGKEATQEELFHTFNELYGSEKQIVLSSDRPPEDLSGLQERLVSRFRWGLVADIQPPDLETRIAILRKKANDRGLIVNDDILELIASRISSNVRALEGALVKAIAYADLQGEDLTPKSLETMLPKEGQRERLSIAHIKEEVASQYHLKRHDLEGSSRKKEISQARHIAIYLAREMTDHSFPAIGKQFGNRDHTTIMHSYMKIKTLIQETPLLYSEIQEIQESLGSRFSLVG
ncbi:TPA: chromosomal replication initiator protein DnaA, partial [Candidatus Acetothermia bacterium]|nr:chromosomal replication initiator protein DnaA [Candidatus Acetothermia bacterium]